MAKKQASRKQSQSKVVADNKTAVSKQNSVQVSRKADRKTQMIVAAVVVVAVLILAAYTLYTKMLVSAYVNGEPVSRLQVINQLEKQGGKSVLDQLVTQKLISQEAAKRHITVTQADINTELKTIEASIAKQGITLDQALQSQGISKDQLNDEIKLQIELKKMVKPSTVTDKEVSDYIDSQKDQITPDPSQDPKVYAAQIKDQLLQQKQQADIQKFVTDLKNKAKITTVTNY